MHNEYNPTEVSPPGETLLDLLEERQMTQADLSERIGLSRKTINEIVKGTAPISQDTALALERVVDVPASFWNNREQHYRQYLARAEERNRLKGQIDWLKKFPVKKMINLGWIKPASDKVALLEEVLRFLGVAFPEQFETQITSLQPAFRKSKAFKGDYMATAAWLRRGEIKARLIDCVPFDPCLFKESLNQIRAMTTEPISDAYENLVLNCAKAGVAVVVVPELPKTHVCGATRWLAPNKAVVLLSTRYCTNDHFWFTFFHEAGHVLKHKKRDIFIDQQCGSAGEEESAMEQEADRFARDLLIPPADWNRFIQQRLYTKDAICHFARDIGVSPGIVVGRLQHENRIPYRFCNGLKKKINWSELEKKFERCQFENWIN